MVVGEDRAARIVGVAGGVEVAGRAEDRVDRVVRIRAAVLVGVHAEALPARRQELHPPDRARGRDVQVAPVVALDLVDRGEHLPAHAVLQAGRLVDRQQERRDTELADDEVRDPGRSRRAGQRVDEAGVAAGGGAVGAAERPGAPRAPLRGDLFRRLLLLPRLALVAQRLLAGAVALPLVTAVT